MKRILVLFIISLLLIPAVAAQNVTITGVSFEIPEQYEHGTAKPNSYVYESGLTFRILNVDNSKNLRLNFGSDIYDADSHEETSIAGHDAVVISRHYNSKYYTSLYFATGDHIFLICFNDTNVNDEIRDMISKTPEQTMSHDEFSSRLNQAANDYQDQLMQEEQDYNSEQYYRNNKPTHRFFFFRF